MNVASYQDLLAEVKSQISEISAADAAARLSSDDPPVLVDVREPDEFDQGAIEGSVHIPRGFLESRIGGIAPDLSTPIILSCQSGARSAFGARSLEELGYEDVTSLAGGFGGWKQAGLPWSAPKVLNEAQRARYSRHTLIPEVGEAGQLQAARLERPARGRRRPRLAGRPLPGRRRRRARSRSSTPTSSTSRTCSARCCTRWPRSARPRSSRPSGASRSSTPTCSVVTYRERLTSENIDRMLEGVDVIVDGTDNFPTRYLLNDASLRHRIPVVHASIYRFEGQLTVFKPYDGPCYRCLFPQPPPPELAPSCAEGGVLGVLPGIMGSLQTNEALKLLLDIGEPPVGRLILFDALDTSFHEVRLRRDPDCPVCGTDAGPIEYIDYEEFCLPPARATT